MKVSPGVYSPDAVPSHNVTQALVDLQIAVGAGP